MVYECRYFIGIDPSLDYLGWSIWDSSNNSIVKCGILRPDKDYTPKDPKLNKRWVKTSKMLKKLDVFFVDELEPYTSDGMLVLESMAVFNKFAAGSLLPLGWITGYLVGKVGIEKVIIAESIRWTSRVPKEVRIDVIEDKIGSVDTWKWEHDKVPAKTYRHNGVDAVGLSLWGAGVINNFKVELKNER